MTYVPNPELLLNVMLRSDTEIHYPIRHHASTSVENDYALLQHSSRYRAVPCPLLVPSATCSPTQEAFNVFKLRGEDSIKVALAEKETATEHGDDAGAVLETG
tara:strand:+ start:7825 stop:8133 length:309 start_codon:yes stop_codon:yes gene_type:complete